MNYLLDTCVVSEAFKTHPAPSVMDWMNHCEEGTLFLSVLTLGELEKGVLKLSEGKKKSSLEAWIHNDLSNRFQGRLLPVDEPVARAWGKLQAEAEKKGKPLPIIDGLIAATALVHKFVVVTRNNPDMEQSGVTLFNPWR